MVNNHFRPEMHIGRKFKRKKKQMIKNICVTYINNNMNNRNGSMYVSGNQSRVLTPSLMQSRTPNYSQPQQPVSTYAPMGPVIPQNVTNAQNAKNVLMNRAGAEQCAKIVDEAYERGFQDGIMHQQMMQQGRGRKRRTTKKKTTRKRSTSRK